jgi:transcriptional regulator with GAF, ATPase, and Fis domain
MFELADGGTLLLDEIGDMSANAQAKVLRALQSGRISRVGSEQSIAVDVRVIAATNKDLETEVSENRFREDLYYRLNVVRLRSPALRERMDDVPLLAKEFLVECCRENGVREKPIDDDVIEALQSRQWPGNVRELKNVIERMVILSGTTITLKDLPPEDRAFPTNPPPPETSTTDDAFVIPIGVEAGNRPTLKEFREHSERRYIISTLEACDWNISRASGILGVERTNLHKKMRVLNIKRS